MYRPYHMYTAGPVTLEHAAPAFIVSGDSAVEFVSPGGVTFEVKGETGIVEIPIKQIVTIGNNNKVTVLSQ